MRKKIPRKRRRVPEETAAAREENAEAVSLEDEQLLAHHVGEMLRGAAYMLSSGVSLMTAAGELDKSELEELERGYVDACRTTFGALHNAGCPLPKFPGTPLRVPNLLMEMWRNGDVVSGEEEKK